MPVLFVGHGSPMNAIEDNVFTQNMRSVGESLPRPTAIVCVSAHWETMGTQVTAMQDPKTIHDFSGFPRELYKVEYPAAGDPALAIETKKMLKSTPLDLDYSWGLDHGTWSVLVHLFPKADIPVIQLSLDRRRSFRAHYELAQELKYLRDKGVLIIGSGNMVHNLRMVAWNKLDVPGFGFDWALEADTTMKALILAGEHERLIDLPTQGRAFQLAIPTPEHYLPLLYAIALQEKGDQVSFFNEQAVGGSLTMTSVKISSTV
ncbi:MAG: 4,5-DOPA dioxygenase extradiol [Candidatus Marinimicrobia bacterium]|nr:4,5-DOPA dioxygenase extradiol [Candidatus Neomarinimicrobiota bacterium]MCF7850037.1 4,5-DOPA dioxygenase extradiol [Candidatus Neomarinimicrobiota bacterium]MCF7905435.1 4,5-DOPA dioxygenase extradiol [Candidatus Neomarinimicrobiota bacterium]